MLFKTFEKKVRAINPKLVFLRFNGPVWGIHLRQPRHPDANEHGLVHVCSVPSPWWYGPTMPQVNGSDSKGMFVRGWHTILRLLVDKHFLSNAKTRAAFGGRWRWDA